MIYMIFAQHADYHSYNIEHDAVRTSNLDGIFQENYQLYENIAYQYYGTVSGVMRVVMCTILTHTIEYHL